MMTGLDPRIKVGSSFFGCGNYYLCGWGPAELKATDRYRTTFDPAYRLQFSHSAMAWVSGFTDMYFYLPALSKSYEMTAGPKNLSIFPNWDHALPEEGDEQVFAWLDVHLKGAPAFTRVSPISLAKKRKRLVACWTFEGPRKVVSADLALSYGDNENWRRRYETIVNCGGSPDRWATFTQDFSPTKLAPEVTEMKVMLYAYWPPGVYWFDNVGITPSGPSQR